MIRTTLAALAALGLSAAGALAQGAPSSDRPAAAAAAQRNRSDEPGANPAAVVERRSERAVQAGEHKITDADIATAPLMEQAKSSHHTVTINGQTIGYTASAGTLTLRSDDGKPIASMFYVAYTADGGKNRPVTFSYNGGPGSASLFVHMGLAGPMHVMTDSPNATHGPPFTITENHESLLDKSDMVFLDAIGAGYSRPLGDTKGTEFWGVDQDIEAFAKGIQRYITVNHRWNSPKFIFGESYGTTRSAGLSLALQQRGIQLNGVLLLSSVLNYGAHDSGFDHSFVSYVPSYAATAVYWKKSAQPANLESYLKQVRDWAAGPYLTALTKGGAISPEEFDATAKQLSAYIGIPADFIKRADLRVDLNHFRAELLRDQGRILGRYDTRFTGINSDNAEANAEYDPSDTGINGAYVAALHDWLETGLGYTTELNYWPSGPNINQSWDWRHRPPGSGYGGGRRENVANTAADLGMAMRENPHLMVYSLNGLYDMATPFFGTEYDISHLYLDPSIKNNVRFAYYPSGHMVYLNQESLKNLKSDVAKFYDEALAKH